jgi:1-deoxy-D-xylulose-5-phosphate synthase
VRHQLEALNNVKAQTERFIVVLNDNEWSIAKNVGAIAAYLNNIVTNPTYAPARKGKRFIKASPARVRSIWPTKSRKVSKIFSFRRHF